MPIQKGECSYRRFGSGRLEFAELFHAQEPDMDSAKSIEERLATVERELAELKTRLPPATKPGNWIEKISGSFKDDPEFDEILRLGREFRQADRPKDEDDVKEEK